MKKNERADQRRPAPSPGSDRTKRDSALRPPTSSAGVRGLLRLRLVPRGEDLGFALGRKAALQPGIPLFRERLPPVERVLRGGLHGPEREALRDRARVAHVAGPGVGARGRGPHGEVAPLLDLLSGEESGLHPREARVAAAGGLAGVEKLAHSERRRRRVENAHGLRVDRLPIGAARKAASTHVKRASPPPAALQASRSSPIRSGADVALKTPMVFVSIVFTIHAARSRTSMNWTRSSGLSGARTSPPRATGTGQYVKRSVPSLGPAMRPGRTFVTRPGMAASAAFSHSALRPPYVPSPPLSAAATSRIATGPVSSTPGLPRSA